MEKPASPELQSSTLVSVTLTSLVVLKLAHIFTHIEIFGQLAIVLMLVLPIAAWKSMHGRELYLFVISVALIVATFILNKPTLEILEEGLGRASFLAAFIVLMALLREGAMTSGAILAVGKYLTHQPPARRFFAIFSGTHFFSSLINLGSLSLFAPIIQRGVRAGMPQSTPLDEISQIREQRQLSAALRGFSWFLLWAPTAVTQAVMPTLMTGIDTWRLIGTGLCLAAFMLCISWFEDTLRWWRFSKRRRQSGNPTPVLGENLPKIDFLIVICVSMVLLALAILFSSAAQVSLINGVMLASPIVVTGWIIAQHRQDGKDGIKPALSQIRTITFTNMPGYIREVLFVACAGLIGTVAAKIIPVDSLAMVLDLGSQPHWLILWGISIFVWMLGQLGLSPVTMAVFLGSVVAEIPDFPVDITLTALAIAAGTAICSTGAPFSAAIMMLSRATGYTPFTLSWRWNGPYTLLAIAMLLPVYILLVAMG